jgi:glycyl-tRNA synthetase beta subunit
LRRDALSVVTILVESQADFDVLAGLELAAQLMPVEVTPEVLADTAEFVRRRLAGILREEYNLPHDVVQAVLVERGNNPWLAWQAARDLAAAVDRPDWEDTLNAYARCVRLVRGIEERYNTQPDLFDEPVETELYQALEKAQARLKADASLADVVRTVSEVLVDPINAFFDGVLVMTDEDSVRQNRLALLQDISDLTKGHADFSQLQGF